MTDLRINDIDPVIMHIDLNSCYAIIEQQANRLIRYKPVGVAAYDSPRGFIIASSYEAKRLGIKLMRIQEARAIAPDIIILTPDPEKYFDAHRRFREVLERYTSEVQPKSIDEFVIDFTGSPAVQRGQSLIDIGNQIKQDIKQALGEYVTVNIGIAPNRFLAKIAAGLDKPDGIDIITAQDIYNLYGQLELIDLPGINYRFQARLNLAEIFTPLDFFEAPKYVLQEQVFKSITGLYWFLRLRGYDDPDRQEFGWKSFGKQYAVGDKTSDPYKLSRLLMKMCEGTGRRLREHGFSAGGVHLFLAFENGMYYSKGRKTASQIYATQEIYKHIMLQFSRIDIPARVTGISVSVYNLQKDNFVQAELLYDPKKDPRALAKAADKINDIYGDYTIVPAIMANMQDVIIKRVPFGSVRDL